jgi:hypothetical protein
VETEDSIITKTKALPETEEVTEITETEVALKITETEKVVTEDVVTGVASKISVVTEK